MDSDSESELISLVTQLLSIMDISDSESDSDSDSDSKLESRLTSLGIQIISVMSSMDLDSLPEPKSKLMSLVTQTISVFNSMDFDSLPKPLSKLISFISEKLSPEEDSNDSDSNTNSEDSDFDSELVPLMLQSITLEPEPELMSLIHQILLLVVSMEWGNLISFSPQVQVSFDRRKSRFRVDEEVEQANNNKWLCLPMSWKKFRFIGEEYTHFLCRVCNGKNHNKEYEEAPVEIKHPLHPKHSLQLVSLNEDWRTRDCCCCDKNLAKVFYYCSACDYAMNIACVDKPQVLYDLESESVLISLITQLIGDTLDPDSEPNPRFISLIPKIIPRVSSLNLASQPKPESKLVSLVKQTTILFNSMDLDSLPKPLSDLISLFTQHANSEDLDLKLFKSLKVQTLELKPEPELLSFIYQILSHVSSIDPFGGKLISLSPQVEVVFVYGKFHVQDEVLRRSNNKWHCLPGNWKKFRLTKDATHFLCKGSNGENHEEYEQAPIEIKHPLHPKHYLLLVSFDADWIRRDCCCCDKNLAKVFYFCSACDYAMNIACVYKPQVLYNLESESTLLSLITQLISSLEDSLDPDSEPKLEFMSLITKMISRVSTMNLDLQPKPESKLMSLVTQTITLFNSMDLDSLPKPLSQLISITTQLFNYEDLDLKLFKSVMLQTLELKPEPELLSIIHKILSHVISMTSNWNKLISLSPQVAVVLEDGKFHVEKAEVLRRSNNKWCCFPEKGEEFILTGEEPTHFRCRNCNGENHEEYEKAPVEIKHPLHPKHYLQLALWQKNRKTRECYCCDKSLKEVFYYCPACDFGMNIACVEKPLVLSVEHPKWHEHTLSLFPSKASIPCNLCALTHSSSPFYICPPCDFVVHQSCLSLPRVIRISRHPHRISFTHSFQKGDWFCGVCRKKINNDYGGYSCIKNGCSYAAHSKCATQRNVWDGIDLEGVPEEIEEEVEPPFVRIRDGIIRHFSHAHHHLRLDENTDRDYDEDKLCQICITPVYFGNFYSCLECEYILHETCANLPRRIYTPIHPHMLNLFGRSDYYITSNRCSACPYYCLAGFFYMCGKCDFELHVQCATISEPLDHGSHIHPLFLTSKPGEKRRKCSVCQGSRNVSTNETFNCIEYECDFALCFKCATIPEKLRYKHDKHVLTLSYGDHETNTVMNWCEACERKIDPEERFYKCDEYCCVTLHIKCLIGKDLYLKPGSSKRFIFNEKVDVLPNNHHMTRPICSTCKKRCPYKTFFVFQSIETMCSLHC